MGGKGKLTKIFQDLHAFSDSLDLCKFSAFAEGAVEYAAQYSAMVGVPFTQDDVMRTGERIYNLERLYNNLAGIGEGSDSLPARFLNEPSTLGGSKGHICELPQMLDEYYAERTAPNVAGRTAVGNTVVVRSKQPDTEHPAITTRWISSTCLPRRPELVFRASRPFTITWMCCQRVDWWKGNL